MVEGDLWIERAQGLWFVLQLYVNRELVVTFAPFGRERLGKWPFHRFLENAECKLLFIPRQACFILSPD